MARSSASPAMSNGSSALFQAWGTALHDMLVAVGLVQTADTGQVNTATMTAPVAINTFAGYEIFKFNDALQATKPIFLKVEYGSGNPLSCPAVRFTVGSATNGAGTLTTPWGAAITVTGTSSSTLPQACYASGEGNSGGSGFVVSMWSGMSTNVVAPFQFFVERSRDAGGLPTGDGLAYGLNSTTRVSAYTGTWSTTNCAQMNLLGTLQTPESTSSTVIKGMSPDGDVLYWLPIVFSCPGVPAWRSKMLVGVHTLDAGMGTTFVAPVYGESVVDGADFTFVQPGNAMPAGGGLGSYSSSSSINYFLSQYWESPPP